MAVWGAVSVLGLLIMGTGSAMLRKVLFDMPGLGLHGIYHTFKKPFFTTFDNSLACCVGLLCQCLILSVRKRQHKRWQQTLKEPLLEQGDKVVVGYTPDQLRFHPISWGLLGKLMWPAMFGRMALILQGMGLKYVSATMNQMIAGSCIIFTAILSATFLKKKLNWMHITGISLTLVGIVVVSLRMQIYDFIAHGPANDANLLAGVLSELHQTAGWEAVLGIVLILVSQAIQAGQLVLEELLLGGKEALEPMEVIGWEGTLSVGWMAIVFLPMAYVLPGHDIDGRQENTVDSFVMLFRNPQVNLWNMIYLVQVVGTNLFGLMVAAYLGSVFRAVLLTTRTGLVWITGLVVYKLKVGGGKYGEYWEPSSWVQLAGFALIIGGTVLYAQGSSKVKRVAEMLEDEGADVDEEELHEVVSLARLSVHVPHRRDDLGLLDQYELPRDVTEHATSMPLPTSETPFHTGRLQPQANRPKSLNNFRRSMLHGSSWITPREDRSSKLVRKGSRRGSTGSLESGDASGRGGTLYEQEGATIKEGVPHDSGL